MLRLYQSNRLEILAQRLAELLAVPMGSPLAPETLVVQHPGMARWLALEIAQRIGICANLRFPLPGAFVWEILAAFLPEIPNANRFAPVLLKWRLFDLLDDLEDRRLFDPLRHYLREGDETRRFQLAERLAELFDRYLVYRPDWILDWEAGKSAIAGDAWQAELWRRLGASQELHWVGLQQALFQHRGACPAGLPERLFLIGVPTLSPGYLQIIAWLSQWLDIHLLLLNPCETHWADIVDAKTMAREELRADGAELYLDLGNPLLASLGRQGRDFFAAINELDPGSEEWFVDPGEHNLLCRLQHQILQLEVPAIIESAQDGSIRMHIFHSPMREVEGLYDQLLAILEAHPELSPADILVMTPEIDDYAPLIDAVFSVPGDRPAIPYRISDQAMLQSDHQIAAFLEVLAIPGSRYTVNQLLGLLEVPSIQRRFGLEGAAMEAVTGWIERSNIRWGRDGESKLDFGLPKEPRNTWRAGLERLLLGFAMPAGGDVLWQGIAPLDAVEGSNAVWLGGLLEFCEALFVLEEQLSRPRSPEAWRDLLLGMIDTFFAPEPDAELSLQQLEDGIRQFAEETDAAGFHGEIALPLVRARLENLFAQPTTRGFLGGGVNFCALAPMRSLPFAVICLLGMNEGNFPRQTPRMDFDLMSRQFRFGDRSRRADDRYLFLETIISAREILYISYVGRSSRDNKSLPPSVLVDELRDYLALQIGEEGVARLTHHHPLQPFSPDYFKPGDDHFSYSARLRELAMLVGRGEARSRPLLSQPLADEDTAGQFIDLKQLLDFFTNPARVFARQRLNLQLESGAALLEEREVFQMEKYPTEELERDLVEALLEGRSGDEVYALMDARGDLPHGRLGRHHFEQLLHTARHLQERLQTLDLGRPLSPVDIELELGDFRLVGRLSNLCPGGQLDYTVGGFHPYRKLNLWIRHLVLSRLEPMGVEPVSLWLEREGEGRFAPATEALRHLTRLLELYRDGLRAPLHFYPGSSWAYAESLLTKGDPEAANLAAWKKWRGNDYQAGDMDKPYHRLLLPGDGILDDAFREISLAVFRPLIENLQASAC